MDYEVDGIGMHTFVNFKSQHSLLMAIDSWFEGLASPEAWISCINFRYMGDGTIDADVHWSYLTEHNREEAERLLRSIRNN